MKKVIATLMIGAFLAGSAVNVSALNDSRGGLMGFIAGCCFGLRTGGAYNDGKEVHWREWVMLIPVANIVFAIWNGIDGANGMQSSDYAAKYGKSFY